MKNGVLDFDKIEYLDSDSSSNIDYMFNDDDYDEYTYDRFTCYDMFVKDYINYLTIDALTKYKLKDLKITEITLSCGEITFEVIEKGGAVWELEVINIPDSDIEKLEELVSSNDMYEPL